MEKWKKMGSDPFNTAMLRTGKAIFDADTPGMARLVAALAFALEGAKKAFAKGVEAATVSASATLNTPNANSANVWNVRSKTDPVSLRGKHIGRHTRYPMPVFTRLGR